MPRWSRTALGRAEMEVLQLQGWAGPLPLGNASGSPAGPTGAGAVGAVHTFMAPTEGTVKFVLRAWVVNYRGVFKIFGHPNDALSPSTGSSGLAVRSGLIASDRR